MSRDVPEAPGRVRMTSSPLRHALIGARATLASSPTKRLHSRRRVKFEWFGVSSQQFRHSSPGRTSTQNSDADLVRACDGASMDIDSEPTEGLHMPPFCL